MPKRREKPKWAAGERAMEIYYANVGSSPRQNMEWALSRVEKNPSEYTPGALQDLLQEIAVFCRFKSKVPGQGAISGGSDDEAIDAPTEAEAREVLDIFLEMLGKAIRRERIHAGTLKIREEVFWWIWPKSSLALGPKRDQYMLSSRVVDAVEWKDLARRAIAHAIVQAGHLLKECPAPAPRGDAGEVCGNWFVAKRPNQEYCSATCQTRASTRAARKAEETAADQKKRERESQRT